MGHRHSKPKVAEPVEEKQEVKQTVEEPKSGEITIKSGEFDDQDIKILTLGAGECGKSTIWRQLKLIYCGGFTEEERCAMKQVVKVNLISDIKELIEALKRSGQSVAAELSNSIEAVSGLELNDDELIPEIAEEISRIWKDPIMQVTYKEANSIGIGDNASYFLDKVTQIAEPDYLPSDEDLLKSRIRTTGIANLDFLINDLKTKLFDVGGQKGERARWQRCFKGVDFLLFVVSLSDFDQCMFEDESIRRTDDSKELFGQIANNQIFEDKPIFLILNKVDIFKKKLAANPEKFRQAYPDFTGDISDEQACIEHVKQTFLKQLNKDRQLDRAWVETITACAMEENSIRDLFQKVARKVLDSRH